MPDSKGKMALTTEIVNPLDLPGWDDFVMTHKDGTFFHTAAWARVLYESYGYNPTYITVMDGRDMIALIPLMDVKSILTGRRGVSLPFSDYCGALVGEPVGEQYLLDQIVTLGKRMGWKYFELRGGEPLGPSFQPSAIYVRHILKLVGDAKRIQTGLRDSTRRNIKKAIAQHVEVTINDTPQYIKEFYRLNCLTRKYHGLPPQPYHFFEKLHEYVITLNRGFVVLATFYGRVIAGAIYFQFGAKLIYKYGAHDKAFNHLRPNNLVQWEAIKWGCNMGYQTLDFGITEPENTGLLQYKRGWGAQEYLVNYYKYDLKQREFVKNTSKVTGFHNNIFQMMPIHLLKIAGSIMYRHAG